VVLATSSAATAEQAHIASTTTVVIGFQESADAAPVELGIKKGFFKKNHLKVTTQVTSGSTTALIPLMSSGKMQFIISSPATLFIADAVGIPMTILGSAADVKAHSPNAELVLKSSGIKTAKDFNNRTFCTTSLGGPNNFLQEAWLEQGGATLSTVKAVPVPSPDEIAAVKNGECAGIYTGEPQYSQALSEGFVQLGNPALSFGGVGVPDDSFGAETSYVQKNPTVVKEFYKAMATSMAYAAKHPAAARNTLPAYTGVTRQVANETVLNIYDPTIYKSCYQKFAAAMYNLGFIKARINLSSMIWNGAKTKK
jgi:NitT/TauT family transport system substrate-binding protein